MDNVGILSLAPAFIAIVLAFITRDALFSLLIGVLVGVLISGKKPRRQNCNYPMWKQQDLFLP